MKWITCLLALALAISGCTTKAKSKREADRAYSAGRQRALAETQPQVASVFIMGNVSNHAVPWTEDLTLAQALIAAQYLGAGNPTEIVVVHNGFATTVDPARLLHGQDMKLEPNDRIEVR
jgi:hypothetical protein